MRLLIVAVLLFQAIACSPQQDKKELKEKARLDSAKKSRPRHLLTELGIHDEKLRKNAVYSLEKGGENLIARAWLCDHAQKTLDIQYYIFARDNTGLIACDFIVRAADRGVKVRLIIDDATVRPNTREISLLDSHDNIEIRVYNPGIKLGSLKLRAKKLLMQAGKLHRRMHNKTIIIDHIAAITGGRNIADEYFDYHEKYNYRDRDALLIGKVVSDVSRSFEEFWNDSLCVPYSELINTDKKKLREADRFDRLYMYAADTSNFSTRMREKIRSFPVEFRKLEESGRVVWTENVSFVADKPGKNRERPRREGGITTDSLIALIANAKRSIDIQSPYLILTDTAKAFFSATVKRGVRVRVLTNSLAATDNYEAFSAYQKDREEILATGIEIYEFKPHPQVRFKVMSAEVQAAMNYSPALGMHSKTMIVDGRITVIGSFNLDPRSADLNTECIAIIRSPEVTANVAKYVEEEFLPGNAWRTTPDYNPDKEAGPVKNTKVLPRKVIPKRVL